MDETTYSVPDKRSGVIEVMVDAEGDNIQDVYFYASDMGDTPNELVRLCGGFKDGLNPVFVHAVNPDAAWEYIREHALEVEA